MITILGYLMGREKEFPITQKMRVDAEDLLNRVHAFLAEFGVEADDEDVRSGYRPGRFNVAAGGSATSGHTYCIAVDLEKHIRDIILPSGMDKIKLMLKKHGLHMESPEHTPTWMHLDTKPRPSLVFIP